MKNDGWTHLQSLDGMKKGDTFTMAGRYKRRTFWQWITNQPKQLQLFKLESDPKEYAAYSPVEEL